MAYREVIRVEIQEPSGAGRRDTVAKYLASVVALFISDVSDLKAGDIQDVSLANVFSYTASDALTITAESSDAAASSTFAGPNNALSIFALADGSPTITVTAKDSEGDRVSDTFDLSVGGPAPVANMCCVAATDRAAFLWDAPQWSRAEVYA